MAGEKQMKIKKITIREQSVLAALLLIWEDSVRQSHHFLTEADITGLRPLVLQGLAQIPELWGLCTLDGTYAGFMGIDGQKLEMLFIKGDQRGRGLGSLLLAQAIEELGVTEVDVNEQNPQAQDFYYKHGFYQGVRSELDGQGNPFPILHLSLQEKLKKGGKL